MSFHTILQIANLGDEPLHIDDIGDRVLAILDHDGVHHDLFSDLRESFDAGESVCRVHSDYLLGLLGAVAAMAPQGHFEVRCFGEEFRHTWIREFSGGRTIFEAGPWEYE